MFQSRKMLSVVVRVALFLLVLNFCVKSCTGYKNYNLYSRDRVQTYNDQQSGDYNAMSSNIPDDNTRRGLGISAWGIIIVVVTIILVIMAAYYFAICYPVCKKRRNHNIKYDNVI